MSETIYIYSLDWFIVDQKLKYSLPYFLHLKKKRDIFRPLMIRNIEDFTMTGLPSSLFHA